MDLPTATAKMFMDYGALGVSAMILLVTLYMHEKSNKRLADVAEKTAAASATLAERIRSLAETVARLADVVHDKLP